MRPINEALNENTMEQIARKLGCTTGAVWQAIRQGRQIFVDTDKWTAMEIKPFPSKGAPDEKGSKVSPRREADDQRQPV